MISMACSTVDRRTCTTMKSRMYSRRKHSSVVLALIVATAACSRVPIDTQPTPEGWHHSLRVAFTVAPAEVRQHDAFTALLTLSNTSHDTIRVVTADSCLAIPNVMRDGTRIRFKGSSWGCYQALTTHTFLPGEMRSLRWDMRAELGQPDDVAGPPAPKGTYHVQALFYTYATGVFSREQLIERFYTSATGVFSRKHTIERLLRVR